MRPHHPSRHAPHTGGPSGGAHMRPRHTSRYTPHRFRGPIGSSTECSSGGTYMRPRKAPVAPISAHPSHVPWSYGEFH
eukprot:6102406-Pyramimonas_sp.AAC.1